MKVWRPQTAHALKQTPAWDDLQAEVAACPTVEAVGAWWAAFLLERHRDYPEGWSLALRDACEARRGELETAPLIAAMDAAYSQTVSP